jgi:hypothetical protein
MGGSGHGRASVVQWSMADDRVLEEAVMCARRDLFVHWCQDVASYVRNILCLLLHLGSWIYLISLVVMMPIIPFLWKARSEQVPVMNHIQV